MYCENLLFSECCIKASESREQKCSIWNAFFVKIQKKMQSLSRLVDNKDNKSNSFVISGLLYKRMEMEMKAYQIKCKLNVCNEHMPC